MQTELTPLQRSRIEYHCDLDSAQGLLAITYNIRATTFSEIKLRQLVGNLEEALPADILVYDGEQLATLESDLGKVELAFRNINPTLISDSLLVKSAGKVDLRKDEMRARKALYKELVSQLRQQIGLPDSNTRAQLW